MATKTISVDLEAYQRLCRARLSSTESFSRVIRRARWEPVVRTCASLLAGLESLPPVADGILDELDEAQAADRAPDDRWTR
jgi:hypothetical protein